MKAKEYLQQIDKLNTMINNKLIEVEQWKAIATSSTANMDGERVKSSGSQQKMADAVNMYVDISNEVVACIDKLIDTKQEVISTIEQLPTIEYDLLHMVYVQLKPLDSVADKYNKSYSWAATVHGRALQHVQELINKKCNVM